MMLPYDIALLKQLFNEKLKQSLRTSKSKRLDQALSYALLGEGKRLRPLLVLLCALAEREKEQASIALRRAMPAALAVEYVHTYSLIHDDLPAMDNDDYRRGRLSVHRRFDEALAILCGDALLADAFFLLANSPINAQKQCAELADAAGSQALVRGQAEDLDKNPKDTSAWLAIHAQK
ncbi:MAG TPA: polyprenyl synthetase family protein, partial [Myxococcota bacterium]|nr:polyprenyl synthetase family protein [Myxococcota bacterium]